MAVDLRLRVGDTSAQDISLSSSGVVALTLPMGSPEVNQETIQSLGDGNALGVPSYQNVTESIDLHISDTTAALVAAKVEAIERLLNLARQGTLGQFDDKLYLRVQFDNDTLAWRSQILAARLEVTEGSKQIWKKFMKATLIVTRRFYWESEAMQEVAVSSATTTTATVGYATVYNADDTHATQRNWFQIAADQVIGSIPAPAKITIRNVSGASRNFGSVYLGNYVFCDPANVDPIFRWSDAGGADTTPGTTEQDIYWWPLASNGLCDDFRGQFGRFVVVWDNLPAITTLIRAAVVYGNPNPLLDLALGEQMLDTTNEWVMDLGALPIPPNNFIAGMGANQILAVKGKAASGTDTLAINWLQIFPSGAGRYRVLKGITGGLSLATDDEAVDDGPNDSTYVLDDSLGAPIPTLRPLFEPIHLWPNKLQRLRMIIGSTFAFEAGENWGVNVQYRPRRLTF